MIAATKQDYEACYLVGWLFAGQAAKGLLKCLTTCYTADFIDTLLLLGEQRTSVSTWEVPGVQVKQPKAS